MRTVKLRPDQPLFKADAFHMPVGVHASFEIVRGIVKWGTASLHKDNPHNNQLHNATFTRAAQAAHRNAFWTGRAVVVPAKWKIILRRWSAVFLFLCAIKYAPGHVWWSVTCNVGRLLKWIGLTAVPWGWANLWVLPFCFFGAIAASYLLVVGGKAGVKAVRARIGDHRGVSWYVVVLGVRDRVVKKLMETRNGGTDGGVEHD